MPMIRGPGVGVDAVGRLRNGPRTLMYGQRRCVYFEVIFLAIKFVMLEVSHVENSGLLIDITSIPFGCYTVPREVRHVGGKRGSTRRLKHARRSDI